AARRAVGRTAGATSTRARLSRRFDPLTRGSRAKRAGGLVTKRSGDFETHGLEPLHHVLVGESENAQPKSVQHLRTYRVVALATIRIVAVAVQLDNQSLCRAVDVRDV